MTVTAQLARVPDLASSQQSLIWQISMRPLMYSFLASIKISLILFRAAHTFSDAFLPGMTRPEGRPGAGSRR